MIATTGLIVMDSEGTFTRKKMSREMFETIAEKNPDIDLYETGAYTSAGMPIIQALPDGYYIVEEVKNDL